MAGGSALPNGWKHQELELRQQEVRTQRTSKNIQVFLSFVSIVTVTVAVIAAYEGVQALRITSDNNAVQANENQLSTAVSALGSSDAAERVAGLELLRRNASEQVLQPLGISTGKEEAYDAYGTALVVLANYIHGYSQKSIAAPKNAGKFGFGYGTPAGGTYPLDVEYAANEISRLLALHHAVKALGIGHVPSLDLSHDELFGLYWPGVDFSWLSGKFFTGIDLREADLAKSKWIRASLTYAYLQCANLKGANFRGADLRGADLRGANVQGANFKGTHLTGKQKADLYGTAKGLPPGLPSRSWNGGGACVKQFTDNAPGPGSSPSPSTASPSPSPPVTPSAAPVISASPRAP
jgi:hypothetical protein